MKRAPDEATLDAMVAGFDDAGDLDAWDWLLTSASAAESWAQALKRRQRIDQFARALIAHPWLAGAQRAVRVVRGALGRLPQEAVIEAVSEREPLLAVLGPSTAQPSRLASVAWGQLEVVSVPLGTTVALRPVQGEGNRPRFFYQSSVGEGALPDGLWRLEQGEAPVLLLAYEGAASAGTMAEVQAHAIHLAGVLLLEATASDEEV